MVHNAVLAATGLLNNKGAECVYLTVKMRVNGEIHKDQTLPKVKLAAV